MNLNLDTWDKVNKYLETTKLNILYISNLLKTNAPNINDCFSKGQLVSKKWLCDEIKYYLDTHNNIILCGGWYGSLAVMLTDVYPTKINSIKNIDIDMLTCGVAKNSFMNKTYSVELADMLKYKKYNEYNIIINTSSEHLTKNEFNIWLDLLPKDKLIILQNNNLDIPEHTNKMSSLEEFKELVYSKIKIQKALELVLPNYNRYMIIGYKC